MNFSTMCSSPGEVQGLAGLLHNNTHRIQTVEVSCFRWPVPSVERKNVVSVLHLFLKPAKGLLKLFL